jgi:hypothetical protein
MVHHLPPEGGVSFEDVKTVVGHSVVTYRSGKKWASESFCLARSSSVKNMQCLLLICHPAE